jgi:hypothetical protein
MAAGYALRGQAATTIAGNEKGPMVAHRPSLKRKDIIV